MESFPFLFPVASSANKALGSVKRQGYYPTRARAASAVPQATMAKIGLEGEPPRFNFAASLAAFAAVCFIVQGLAGFTAQWIARPAAGSWGKPNCTELVEQVMHTWGPARLSRSCATCSSFPSRSLAQVLTAANPWAFDAMLEVDEVTGLCTGAGSGQRPAECPTPLPGCMGAEAPFPCCVFDPNATSWFASWTRLDRQTAQEQWRKRREADPFLVTSFAAGSLGWIASVPGVTCLATCLGSAHRSVAGAMPAAIKAAAILSLVEFTSQMGAAQMSAWISTWPALALKDAHPDSAAEGAVQALEVSYLLTTSQTLWLYSADRLLLASTLLAAAFATFTSPEHVRKMASTRHAALGLVLSALCIIGFAFDVLRFVSWAVAGIGLAVMSLLIEMIFLPIWLLWLACVLRRISAQGGSYGSTTSVELGERSAADVHVGV